MTGFSLRRRSRTAATFSGSLLLAALGGCLGWSCSGEVPEGPDILLITIDTLSFRDVGHLGGSDSTPHLDRLAAGAAVFDRAYSTSSWTAPAVASQLTGLFPSKHGVRRLFQRIPESVRTLSEELLAAGYSTAGVITNYQLRAEFGFAQGFESWDDRYVDYDESSSRQVTDAAIDWLRRRPKGKPFFLYLHYMDPHFPYLEQAGFGPPPGHRGPLTSETTRRELEAMLPDLEPEDLEHWRDLYRGEVEFTDAQIGRLLDALDRMGLDDVLIVVTSDHGEEFFEHGWFEHTRTLYDEIARVVFLVRRPGFEGRRVSTPVSLVDVAPTILDVAGVEPEAALHGRSLVEHVVGQGVTATRMVFLETDFVPHVRMEDAFDSRLEVTKNAVVDGELKLIHDLKAGSWSLFDLAADPFETTSLFESHGSSSRLRDALVKWESWSAANRAPAEKIDPSAADIENLRGLGYLQ